MAETPVSWRQLVMPKEHGSWSLAFEPAAVGLCCAPSLGGVGLAIAIAAGFFARRPLRTMFRDPRETRRRQARQAVATCAGVAGLGVVGAMVLAGGGWLVWLLPAVVCGGIFAAFDLRNEGRQEGAEIAGALAFASLPAAFGALALFSPARAAALGLIMIARAVPTVVFVRAAVRGRKLNQVNLLPAAVAATAAVLLAFALAARGLAPAAAVVAMVFFLGRISLVAFRPTMRAKQLGIFEAVAGIGFVITLGVTW